MKTPKPKARAARATPTLRQAAGSDQAKVAATDAMSLSMPASPEWAQATEAQAALVTVKTDSAAIAQGATVIVNLRTQLHDAVAKQLGNRRDWEVSARRLLSTVEVFCAGNADRVAAFGFGVRQRVQNGPIVAPTNLVAQKGKSLGDLKATWDKGNAHHGFVVQHATDPANAATYSANLPSTKPSVTIHGLPSGTVAHVRVAAIDPKSEPALGPWSDWTSGTVR